MALHPRQLAPLLVLAWLSLAVGCGGTQQAVLERELLFQLDIGRLEDHLDIFARDGVLPRERNTIFMRDGLIFIGNGPVSKVMEFTSFGDMIRLIYHPGRNPEPVTLERAASGIDGRLLTRVAVPYPFGGLGDIAVDSRRYLYAEDRLDRERSLPDEELGVVLNRIVLRFDDDGTPLDYIGQEGIGGTPFPFIERLEITRRDELAVVTSTPDTRLVFLYSANGDQMFSVRIGLDQLPVPERIDPEVAVLDAVIPGPDAYRIYLKVSYYRTAVDVDTGTEYGITFDHSRIYWVDLETGRYDGFVELPVADDEIGGGHFEFLGVARDEHFFLLARDTAGQARLLIMNDDGRVIRRRILNLSESELVVRSFRVSTEGVLTALLGYEDRAEVVWWRSDLLLPGETGGIRADE